jgi:hypothetical protein
LLGPLGSVTRPSRSSATEPIEATPSAANAAGSNVGNHSSVRVFAQTYGEWPF